MSDLPVRVLIVTDHHDNHTGNNAQFLAAGIPIIAPGERQAKFLQRQGDGATAAAPTVTYDRDYALRLGGSRSFSSTSAGPIPTATRSCISQLEGGRRRTPVHARHRPSPIFREVAVW
jgi:glyoxylase-like metal-dependent hydrolase (beta-lactamase superfamily II)